VTADDDHVHIQFLGQIEDLLVRLALADVDLAGQLGPIFIVVNGFQFFLDPLTPLGNGLVQRLDGNVNRAGQEVGVALLDVLEKSTGTIILRMLSFNSHSLSAIA
jgi:hypothetical protein